MPRNTIKLDLQLVLAERLAMIPFRQINSHFEDLPIHRHTQQTYPKEAGRADNKPRANTAPEENIRFNSVLQQQNLELLEVMVRLQERDAALQFLSFEFSKLRQLLGTKEDNHDIEELKKDIRGLIEALSKSNELCSSKRTESTLAQAPIYKIEQLLLEEPSIAKSDEIIDGDCRLDDNPLIESSQSTLHLDSSLKIRTQEGECRFWKYKERIHALEVKLAEETQRRKEAELHAETLVKKVKELEAEHGLDLAATDGEFKRQKGEAENYADAAQDIAMAGAIRINGHQEKLLNVRNSFSIAAEKEGLRQELLCERAATAELRRQLAIERAQRALHEEALATREAALREVERRYKQLDAIVKRVAQRAKGQN